MDITQPERQVPQFCGRWCGLDLRGCDRSVLTNRVGIEKYIGTLCRLLDFKPFGEPTIVHFGERPEIAGYSFTQLIETSLVSGHLVDESCCAFIDIFSCSEYSVDTAQRFTREYFSRGAKIRSLVRGDGTTPIQFLHVAELGIAWVRRFDGWGAFTVAEVLESDMATLDGQVYCTLA